MPTLQSICFVLLSGGLSSRITRDKGLIQLGRKPLIQYVLDSVCEFLTKRQLNTGNSVKIVLNNHVQQKEYLETIHSLKENQIIIDEVVWNKFFSDIPQPPRGSIFGLWASMVELRTEFRNIFALPCDTPLISLNVLNYIFNKYSRHNLSNDSNSPISNRYNIYIPQWQTGKFEPFFSIYHINSILPILEQKIFKKHYSFQKTFEEIRLNPVFRDNKGQKFEINIVPILIEKELQRYDRKLYNFLDIDSEEDLKKIEKIIS